MGWEGEEEEKQAHTHKIKMPVKHAKWKPNSIRSIFGFPPV